MDLGAKGAKYPIPITYILIVWHGKVNPVALSLCLFRLHLHQHSETLCAEDDEGKLDSYVKREYDFKEHIPYQRD